MKLIVSFPPHWHGKSSEAKIYLNFIIALLPAVAYAVRLFGMDACRVIALAVSATVITEFLIRKLFKRKSTLLNGGAFVTGLLFALLLPPSVPFWLVIAGCFFTVLVGKEIFGGAGSNPFNPVLVGWAVCRVSWPAYFDLNLAVVNYNFGPHSRYPLTLLKKGGLELISGVTIPDLLLNQVGNMGSAAVILLAAGGLYLLLRKHIRWEIVVSYAIGILVLSTVFRLAGPGTYADPLFHLFSGNAVIGIFFLATDYSSSPFNKMGMIIFGLGCGFLTILLRIWSIYPDGVVFAILIMNLFTPLLDKLKKKPVPLKVSRLEKGML